MDEVDVVVVGAGTGMFAALTAAHEGLSVLLVEKAEHVGGSTSLSGGGFWIPGNSIPREHGQCDDPERIRAYLRAVTRGEVENERWRSHVDHGPAAVDLLRRLTPVKYQFMREYPDYFPELPGGSATGRACEPKPFDLRRLGADRRLLLPPTLVPPVPMPVTGRGYRRLNLMARSAKGLATGAGLVGLGVGGMALGREYAAGGQALAAGLLAGARSAGVRLRTGTSLKDLVVKNGAVVGVVVEQEGRSRTVRARRGVILASGGFDRNARMRHDHQSPFVNGSWSFGSSANVGDAIRIAKNHGADLAFMDAAWWIPAVPAPGPHPWVILSERSLPGQIIVNGHGYRFMNEAVNYMTAGQIIIGKHTPHNPHIPAWLVFDQRYRNRYLFGGRLLPRQPLPKAWYDTGVARTASTLDELAALLGMADLPATVRRFNQLARAGRDDDFGRGDSAYDRYYGDPTVTPNPCLGPVDRAPYHAVQVVPGDLGTCGGIRADKYARALRPDGSPIVGLYATGNAAGNAFGRVYPGPGATIGQGLTFGYLAARHTAGRVK